MIKSVFAVAALALLISGPARAMGGAEKSMENSAKEFCGSMQDSKENAMCMSSMKKMMMKHMKKMKKMKK